MKFLGKYWLELMHSAFLTFGAIFLGFESYEVLTDCNVKLSLLMFLFLTICPGLLVFLLDGYCIRGFLLNESVIPIPRIDTKITVKFGDLFKETGWKAIAVSDFFDNIVDEDLVSSKSLHGHVLKTYWRDNREDWKKQINASLNGKTAIKESRSKGNQRRYSIGTTARAVSDNDKFLFVALAKTNSENNVTTANCEMLICAVRGMLEEARAACSMDPLIIPLLGSGLSRIGIKNSVLIDFIIAAILEESRHGKITGEIKIVLPADKAHDINLKNHIRNWTHGK